MPDATGPVTLGDLVREDKLLWVYCSDCCHERDLNHATVPLPPETPVPELDKRNYLVGAGRTYLGCRQARGSIPGVGSRRSRSVVPSSLLSPGVLAS